MSQNAYPHAIQTVSFYGEQIQINAEFGLICCNPAILQKINHTLITFTEAVGKENLRYLTGFSKQRPFVAAKILYDFLENASECGADVELYNVYDKTLEAMAEFHLARSENESATKAEIVKAPIVQTTALINIQANNFNGQAVNSVSARELYAFLEIKREFTNWVKPYINRDNAYGFVQAIDFIRFDGSVNPTNNIPLIDYAFTIDMAKEVSMLSKTAKGKVARKYFIECEKQAHAPIVTYKPESKIKHIINAAAMRVANMMIEGMKISPERKTLARAEILHQQFGISIESLLPETNPMLSATDIAEKLGKSANAVGRLMNQLGIKNNSALAQLRLSKSPHSSKEVEQWFYDPRVIEILRKYIDEVKFNSTDELALA